MIRRACLADAEAIHTVHTAAIRELAASHYSSAQIDAWCGKRSASSYGAPIESNFMLVAFSPDGVIQGFSLIPATRRWKPLPTCRRCKGSQPTVGPLADAIEPLNRGWKQTNFLLLATLQAH
jgi:hypothetical protein